VAPPPLGHRGGVQPSPFWPRGATLLTGLAMGWFGHPMAEKKKKKKKKLFKSFGPWKWPATTMVAKGWLNPSYLSSSSFFNFFNIFN